MAQASHTFRVFISSTFNDLKAERNALQEKVYPRLKALCAQHGTYFQAIDLRWGVSEEASLDQQTMAICLGEIARCQKTSPRPNFVILLGDRYGWCPLPSQIPSDEYEQIYNRTVGSQNQKVLDTWYRLDKNAVPPEYILQPRFGELEMYQNQDLWEDVETSLRQILLDGVEKAGLSEDEKRKYIASATEQEIVEGALNVADAKQHVFGFFRHIEALPVNIETKDFHNLVEVSDGWEIDQQAQDHLAALKTNLRKILAGNITEYSVAWDQVNHLPGTNHLDRLCEDVYNRLERVVLAEIDQLEQVDPLDQEIHAHQVFAEERTRIFVGREALLETIGSYLSQDQARPLCVWGQSGTGKSALMAKAVQKARLSYSAANVIYRFVGITPDSYNGRSLLESLCRQITRIYGGDELGIPNAFDELVHELPNRFGLVRPDEPLFLFIDALNQLSDADNAKDLEWLPTNLPVGVHMIVSTMPGICLDALKEKQGTQNLLELGGLPAQDGEKILDEWLAESHRILQREQKSHVLSQFAGEGSPLYLRLAFEEARRWKSYEGLPCGADNIPGLSRDIPGILKDLFWRLSRETNHGKMMVSRSMGYLAAARYGLSEDELLNILSLDDAVVEDFRRRSPRSPVFTQLPVVVWSRLYYEFAPYMTEIDADGVRLMSFYHPQLAQVVAEEFLSEEEKQKRHQMLAQYFETLPLFAGKDEDRIPNLRKLSEQPWQLNSAGEWDLLYQLLVNLDWFDKLYEHQRYDLYSYWVAVENNTNYDKLSGYQLSFQETWDGSLTVVNRLGLFFTDLGNLDYALELFRRMADIFREKGDNENLWVFLLNQAGVLERKGDLTEAVDLYREVEFICKNIGNEDGAVKALGNRAAILSGQGKNQEAMELLKEQEQICRRLNHLDLLASSLGNQAGILRSWGQMEAALTLLDEVERILKRMGDLHKTTFLLGNQGVILQDIGKMDLAMEKYKQQELLSRQLGYQDTLQNALGNQAVILKIWGRFEEAFALLKEQERICRKSGFMQGLSESLGNQANLIHQLGRLDEALALHKEEERISREVGDLHRLSLSLGNQALIYADQGEFDIAMSLHKENERISRNSGNLAGVALALGNQAFILYDLGRLSEAMELHKQEETICRQLGDLDGLSFSLGNQALILQDWGRLDEAMALHKEEERISRQLGDLVRLQDSLGNQAIIFYKRGQFKEALALHKEKERICRQTGYDNGLCISLANQSVIMIKLGQNPQDLVQEALTLASEHGYRDLLSWIREINNQINQSNKKPFWRKK